MAFLPIIKPQKLIRVIEKQGFVQIRQSGSHAVFRNSQGKKTVIPIHRKTVGKGLLHSVLADIGISLEEFKKLL